MIYRTLILATLLIGSLHAEEKKLNIRDGDRGRYEAAIPPGNHTLTIHVDSNAPHIAAQCDDVTFLDVK